jgi:MFS family permease
MSAAPIPALSLEQSDQRPLVRRMATLFGIVYFAQGICQVPLLLNQPVKYYLRQELGYSADQIARFMFLAMIPWMVKPIYGLLSDFVPIGGYRRKSYLLIMNLLAAGAFCWAMNIYTPALLTVALVMTAVGIACSDVVTDALMVETGQRTGRVKLFQGVQWTCISLSAIGSAAAGGYLSEVFPPGRAFRVAALICAAVAASVAIVAWLMLDEPKSRLDLPQLKSTGRSIISAFTSLRLWLVIAYLFLAHFNPGMVTPLYVHYTETMGFSQATAGNLEAVASGGYVVGAALFTLVIATRFSTRQTLVIALLVFAAGALSFLMLRDLRTAVVASFIYGVGYMLSNLAILSVAAEACPRRAEGFTFAAIMSVLNVALQGADWTGSYLYEHVTHKSWWPLPIISATITLIAVALVPLLPRTEASASATETT